MAHVTVDGAAAITLINRMHVAGGVHQMALEQAGEAGGDIAVLSATPNATNQNAWIKVMKEPLAKPEYSKLKLVKIAYGNDDDHQKPFQEAQRLLQSYPTTSMASKAAISYAESECGADPEYTGPVDSPFDRRQLFGSCRRMPPAPPLPRGPSAHGTAGRFARLAGHWPKADRSACGSAQRAFSSFIGAAGCRRIMFKERTEPGRFCAVSQRCPQDRVLHNAIGPGNAVIDSIHGRRILAHSARWGLRSVHWFVSIQ